MVGNWALSKDDLYGPPPAYSITNNYENPPPSYTPSIYIVPIRNIECSEGLSPHASIVLPKNFARYLLGTGLVHISVGLAAIICDIFLTIMNESFSFTGLWTGALSIILGVDLILFMSRPKQRLCSLKRVQFIHMAMCLVSIVALIFASINLASDSCYKILLGSYRCQHSAYIIKVFLVVLFSFTFVQVCITIVMTFVNTSKSRQVPTRSDSVMSEIVG